VRRSPKKLAALQEDSPALWGIMTPQHMVEHLSGALAMSRAKFKLKQETPEEHLAAGRAWLRSGKPFRKGRHGAGMQEGKLMRLRFESLNQAKAKLLAEIEEFYAYWSQQEDGFQLLHPIFGLCNEDEWEQFNYKHCYHHLAQFGLLPEVEELQAIAS
jgi:hypothetical protein